MSQSNSNNNNNNAEGQEQQQEQQQQQQQPAQQQQQQWMQQQQQQQWMMAMNMQYPASAMAMMQQQMMMYHHPQHYMAYNYHPQQLQFQQQQQQHHMQQQQHQQQHQQQQQKHVLSSEDVKTIWVGDLHHWMDETYLNNCFSHTGEVVGVKVIRNKQTGQSEGYGFVEFFSRATAEKVLENFSSILMPNTDQPFRLNWATFSTGDKKSDAGSDLSIFVGDLASDVTDAILQETFSCRYPSVKGAKVVIDSNSGRSKGYGFVRFGDESERTRAMTEMNGTYCSSRPMRIGVATPKKSSAHQQQYSSQAVVLAGGHGSNGSLAQNSQFDSENTTIFVGGLDSDVSDEDLKKPFSEFGEVISVKIPVGKGCGFVQFANRKDAEDALEKLSGTVIGKQTVRLSWGRSPANKQWRADSTNQGNGGHYGGRGHGGNGSAQNQDSGMYAAAANGDH